MIPKSGLCLLLTLGVVSLSSAAIIGTNTPAAPLTAARIAALPVAQRAAWTTYLERSHHTMQADKDALQAEAKKNGVKEITNGPPAKVFGNLVLTKSADWYAGDEARRVADIVVSFQTPAGGWSKRLNMADHVRKPGEMFTSDNASHFLTNADNDLPEDTHWSYVGTFDNDSTTTQLRYLAKVISVATNASRAVYQASFLRGIDYIADAQYPNGGWPQVWPLQGGYHDAITYNDGAMIHIMEFLRDVSSGQNEFSFVPPKAREVAAMSMKRGLECILASQIVVNGRRTVWCQQHDELTLQPTSARNYEMPSASGGESAEIMMFLMQLPNPDAKTIAAVKSAAQWFEQTQINGFVFKFTGLAGRQLIASPGSGPMWARYYEVGSDRPIFGDRDKTIHDLVSEISAERRKGYSWFGDAPKRALEHYKHFLKAHP